MTQATCRNCLRLQTQPQWPGYSLWCIHCCVRLVESARPIRVQQEALLAAIARHPGAPPREAILSALTQAAR